MPQAISHLLVDYRAAHAPASQRVTLWVEADMLQLASPAVFRQIPLAQIQWSEARSAKSAARRQISFGDGSHISAVDAMLWDAWLQAMPRNTGSHPLKQVDQVWLVLGTMLILSVAALSGWRLLAHWQTPPDAPSAAASEPASPTHPASGATPKPTLGAAVPEAHHPKG